MQEGIFCNFSKSEEHYVILKNLGVILITYPKKNNYEEEEISRAKDALTVTGFKHHRLS